MKNKHQQRPGGCNGDEGSTSYKQAVMEFAKKGDRIHPLIKAMGDVPCAVGKK